MKELLETLAAWRAEGVDAGRAVVVRTFGSAPRPEGAVLIVAHDGRIAGSVSSHVGPQYTLAAGGLVVAVVASVVTISNKRLRELH